MVNFKKYYGLSAVWTAIGIAAAFFYAGLPGAFIALLLGALEISVSLDNAVVNAKVMQGMDDKWRHRFLTIGMLFSVAIVRVLFPIFIVWGTSSLGLIDSAYLPFKDPALYASTVGAAHVKIAGFGGTFLLMVFLSFMMDEEKETNWLPGIEKLFKFVGGSGGVLPVAVWTSVITCLVEFFVIPGAEQDGFGIASTLGMFAWLGIHFLGEYLGNKGTAATAGLGAFLYLNVLDASFSFDGVIGAFAVSDSIILIAIGLGIGSLFVRSMTIHMVDKGTLGELKYLEHGAFWSIGVLTALMFASTVLDIPEVVSGLSAAGILAIAVIHSLMNKEPEEATA